MKRLKLALILAAVATLTLVPLQIAPKAQALGFEFCRPLQDLFCDNFIGRTWYKDQTQFARWNRYPDGDDYATDYIDTGSTLKLQINTNSTDTDYVDANISTNIINDVNPYLRFGVNTRAEARIRFSPNHRADPANPGTALGSAGFLFWNYFQLPVNPEEGYLARPQDVFGFTWQDGASTLPGLKVVGVAQGVPGFILPVSTLDISEWHTYTMERRHESMKFFVDGVLYGEVPLNQPGSIQLPDDHGLAMDMWQDNATYIYDLANFVATPVPNHLTENTWIEVDYVHALAL